MKNVQIDPHVSAADQINNWGTCAKEGAEHWMLAYTLSSLDRKVRDILHNSTEVS